MPTHSRSRLYDSAFTIVELLVVIVVIGILAAITIVSYTGITQRAVTSSLQSDLTNASQQLKLYYQLYNSYPTAMNGSNCPTTPAADNTYCLKASAGNTLIYSSIASTTFHLTDTNTNSTSYSATDSTTPAVATTATGSSTGSSCPTGFIPVPGSGTYGTNDFCVMKYAASHSDATSGTQGTSTIPISAPSVQQWVSVSQTTAIADAPNVANCPTCHLITEAEWMTIAQNVLSVSTNWSGGSVGNGAISSGHNDSQPNNALVADPSDANGNAGETNQTFAQKRTLTLINGQVIWDLAGNLWNWTQGATNGITAQEPGIPSAGWNWREWTAITASGSLAVNPSPAGTSLSGANTWDSSKGVGTIYSNSGDAGLYGFIRGGDWTNGLHDGVLVLTMNNSPNGAAAGFGFRVSK